ncbi:PRC-barrel domain protein [Streptomyces ferrugineus]|uniref:PRC-barrel domain protein n=2 Tax=Streptomyces ferrugineus TaxID=1413221 RepID=A0A7M2SY02_9ACTN|nr:PRC-barrel domain protein [Streptomyces ferrugineus]
MRAGEITRKPVVALSGEDVGQIKGLVFDASTGGIRCFTLADRGCLPDESALEEDDTAAGPGEEEHAGVDVLGVAITTRDGAQLGTVTDAVVATGKAPVVADYEVETAEHRRVTPPVAGPVTVSGERVLVPDAGAEHSTSDLGGFGTAVEDLRDRLPYDPQEK